MIQESIYKKAKCNVTAFANVGLSDSAMSLNLLEMYLMYSLIDKEDPQHELYGCLLLATSAAVIHRYEEQNNLQPASPTNPEVVHKQQTV